jgi:hypothetical protein
MHKLLPDTLRVRPPRAYKLPWNELRTSYIYPFPLETCHDASLAPQSQPKPEAFDEKRMPVENSIPLAMI